MRGGRGGAFVNGTRCEGDQQHREGVKGGTSWQQGGTLIIDWRCDRPSRIPIACRFAQHPDWDAPPPRSPVFSPCKHRSPTDWPKPSLALTVSFRRCRRASCSAHRQPRPPSRRRCRRRRLPPVRRRLPPSPSLVPRLPPRHLRLQPARKPRRPRRPSLLRRRQQRRSLLPRRTWW